jgi:hypothetical protein
MGVRILYDTSERIACLYDSTSGHAFGPLISEWDIDGSYLDAETLADDFLKWLDVDARQLSEDQLDAAYGRFLDEQRKLAIEESASVSTEDIPDSGSE